MTDYAVYTDGEGGAVLELDGVSHVLTPSEARGLAYSLEVTATHAEREDVTR